MTAGTVHGFADVATMVEAGELIVAKRTLYRDPPRHMLLGIADPVERIVDLKGCRCCHCLSLSPTGTGHS